MRARGDQRLDDAIGRALAAGPSDVLGLLEALRRDPALRLARREGVLHAALQRLGREGLVAVADGRSPRGLALYARPGDAAVAGASPAGAAPATESWATRAAAVVRDEVARERIAQDLTAHRAALSEAGRVGDLGHVRHVRALLRRVDRRKRSVLLPDGLGDHALRFALHEGPWILLTAVIFLALHRFVAQVFVIPSDSMVPTLLQRDRVVVHKRGAGWVPERWRVVTYQRPGPDGPKTTYVKRVVGLPGEDFALWRGDAYAGDVILVKPDDLNAVLRSRVKAWDLSGEAPPAGWVVTPAGIEGTSWLWDARQQPFWTGSYELDRRFALQDVYLELDVDRVSGGAVELRLGRGAGEARGRAYTLEVEGGSAQVRVHGIDETGAATVQDLASGSNDTLGRSTLRLALIDGILRAEVGGFRWRGAVDAPAAAATFGFTLRHGTRPLAFRLDQDLHYGTQGGLAVPGQGPVRGPGDFSHRIGPAAVFCLGDNTADSRDSRFPEVGDIPLAQLIGPVIFRLWPPGRVGIPR